MSYFSILNGTFYLLSEHCDPGPGNYEAGLDGEPLKNLSREDTQLSFWKNYSHQIVEVRTEENTTEGKRAHYHGRTDTVNEVYPRAGAGGWREQTGV